MLARGQTQTVTLPITAPEPGQEPGHSHTAAWESRVGWRMWVCGLLELLASFHFLPPPLFWGLEEGLKKGLICRGGGLNLICVDCICRWHDGLDLKMWRLNDKWQMSRLKGSLVKRSVKEHLHLAKQPWAEEYMEEAERRVCVHLTVAPGRLGECIQHYQLLVTNLH